MRSGHRRWMSKNKWVFVLKECHYSAKLCVFSEKEMFVYNMFGNLNFSNLIMNNSW